MYPDMYNRGMASNNTNNTKEKKMQKLNTTELTSELSKLINMGECDRHFTACCDWESLEEAGLIDIYRPTHGQTQIPYSIEYWSWELTNEGQSVVDAM